MAWDLKSDRPIYAQLIEQILLRIVSGSYPPGGKLPSVRDMAANAAPEIYNIGDSFAGGRVLEANRAAFRLAARV